MIRDLILMLRNEKYLYLYFSESTTTTQKRVSAVGLGGHTKTLQCLLSLYIYNAVIYMLQDPDDNEEPTKNKKQKKNGAQLSYSTSKHG